jgi:hypothetical protein
LGWALQEEGREEEREMGWAKRETEREKEMHSNAFEFEFKI